MQSLKSTAFAVTLLAISFGLYCVSSTDTRPLPEADLIEPIRIENDFSGTEDRGNSALTTGMANPESFASAPPVAELNDRYDSTKPTTGLPQLPKLTAPKLTTPKTQFASTPSKPPSSPLELPNFSSAEPNAPILSDKSNKSDTLELPEFSTRQPVSTNPRLRDEGLIDALKTTEFKSAEPMMNPRGDVAGDSMDRSFNSPASATAIEGGFSGVKTAEGSAREFAFAKTVKPTTPVRELWNRVDQWIAEDDYLTALEELSRHYVSDEVRGPQRQRLMAYLDGLAGKVIYSSEHHLAGRPYTVKPGDTLKKLADQLRVPTEVIYNINRDKFSGDDVTPGMELKIVQGPFHAEIDLGARQLTLFVGDLYAGRFPIIVGTSGSPDAGNHTVVMKQPKGFTWRDENGNDVPPESPNNAYGPYWIGLSESLCIHAVSSGTSDGHLGCIGLNEKDAKDVFGMLSKDSQIRFVE